MRPELTPEPTRAQPAELLRAALERALRAVPTTDRSQVDREIAPLLEAAAAAERHQRAALTAAIRSHQNHAQEAQAQAMDVSNLSSALSELRQTAAQVGKQSRDMHGVAEESLMAVGEGAMGVEESLNTIRALRQNTEEAIDRIQDLREQSAAIGEIIGVVGEVASQSKLLALNASIEAARAGPLGRSFGVVAAEMRDLAEQSRQATVQVREILTAIQDATAAAARAATASGQLAEKGEANSSALAETITTLTDIVAKAFDVSSAIETSAQEQAAGVAQAADAMYSIHQRAEDSAAQLRGISAALDGLSRVEPEQAEAWAAR